VESNDFLSSQILWGWEFGLFLQAAFSGSHGNFDVLVVYICFLLSQWLVLHYVQTVDSLKWKEGRKPRDNPNRRSKLPSRPFPLQSNDE
jgi:hypothetical protein